MHGTYLQNKNAIYNYRKKNPEKCKEIQLVANRKHYEKKKYYNVEIVCKEHLRLLRNLY